MLPLCDILVPWLSLKMLHKSTAQCKKGVEQKQCQLVEKEARAVTSRPFSTYMHPLDMVPSFKYLGRVLLAEDDDCTAVIRNLMKVRIIWRRMSRIMIRKGGRPQVPVFFFKDVAQLVLLFGAETWVVTPRMGWFLGSFQDQVTWRLVG